MSPRMFQGYRCFCPFVHVLFFVVGVLYLYKEVSCFLNGLFFSHDSGGGVLA